jgi:hypothetical protein
MYSCSAVVADTVGSQQRPWCIGKPAITSLKRRTVV